MNVVVRNKTDGPAGEDHDGIPDDSDARNRRYSTNNNKVLVLHLEQGRIKPEGGRRGEPPNTTPNSLWSVLTGEVTQIQDLHGALQPPLSVLRNSRWRPRWLTKLDAKEYPHTKCLFFNRFCDVIC
ncbi:hypothetical protein E2C01_061276 [Portunus trituberculatus]|uniref:Uncharacterized protein n=1 Tax=Portunus trituberculatus TaxID=210409 RepID=A0A5B7H4R4_PORTR|nr:hypothetical protein [Portunus trituberculatus]